jgi:glycine cleavage system H protein
MESEVPEELRYTRDHEWLKLENRVRTLMGIMDYAQKALTDIVFVEIAVEVGTEINAGDVIATVESVNSASDIYSPVGGKIIEINQELPEAPDTTINKDPYGQG